LRSAPRKRVVKRGGDTWFFLTADYAFGHSLERDATQVIVQNGGKLIDSVAHPFSTPDLSSFILQAQSSKAKIIGLASGPPDNVNAIKLGGKFGIFQGGQQMASLLVLITDVNALGLKAAQGLLLTTSLLLGYRRQNPRMVEAFLRQDQPDADDVASRRLFDGDALSQSDRSGRHQRAAQGRG
jgi:ABC-type branched-subunit amino acid transport system substrate-binding protein